MRYQGRRETIRDIMRTELRNLNAPFIIETRETIRRAQGGICPYCCRKLRRSDATIDHVLPKSAGGLDGPGNWLATCGPCNHEKGDDMPNGCAIVWVLAVNARIGAEPVTW